jgi:hypothetical protein
MSYLEGMNWHKWEEFLGGDSSIESSLAPMIAELRKVDQDHFREMAEQGVFYENVEEMMDCFSTELVDATMKVGEVEP